MTTHLCVFWFLVHSSPLLSLVHLVGALQSTSVWGMKRLDSGVGVQFSAPAALVSSPVSWCRPLISILDINPDRVTICPHHTSQQRCQGSWCQQSVQMRRMRHHSLCTNSYSDNTDSTSCQKQALSRASLKKSCIWLSAKKKKCRICITTFCTFEGKWKETILKSLCLKT